MKSQSTAEVQSQHQTETSALANDYSELLNLYGVNYRSAEHYFQIGEIDGTQGWILHISVVLSQITDLLQTIAPYLIAENVPFKIIKNLPAAEDILSGNLGVTQIGKIVCIYPKDNFQAFTLAKHLITLTHKFKGPAIPTDLCLGNIVYTRYGGFNPIIKYNEKGSEEKFIYDEGGRLVPDLYAIPFQHPKTINWPFSDLTEPILPEAPKYFNRIYKILSILKNDFRGNVFQGLYLKHLFNVKKCVLKQGFTNSDSDIFGRDIRDKLRWQVESYKDLCDSIPLPELYDFIQEDAYSLLVMQYVNGDSLYQKVQDLNPNCKAWLDLPLAESLTLINYVLEISRIISRIHSKGYVHRDVMPVNFLIDKKNRLFVIDLELAYSLQHNRPDPPFRLGTPGFASPEQMQTFPPKFDQDIFSLGAVLLWIFTGLTPIKFYIGDVSALHKNIEFFTQDDEISSVVSKCLRLQPSARPEIAEIIHVLEKVKSRSKQAKKDKPHVAKTHFCEQEVSNIVDAALLGLTKSPVISSADLWFSKKMKAESPTLTKCKQYARYPGISEGMAGPLYVLARLHASGIKIGNCLSQVKTNLDYIENTYLSRISELSPSLYYGAAGLALALKESLRCGWNIGNKLSHQKAISDCLDLKTERLPLSVGIAGQGIAILQCKSLLTEHYYHSHLIHIVEQLMQQQEKNEVWQCSPLLDVAEGSVGIFLFLLEYLSIHPDKKIQHLVERGLSAILNPKKYMKSSFMNLIGSRASYDLSDGGMGVILLTIKAYEVLGYDQYKQFAKNALLKYPQRLVLTNFTQQNGLAGLGEIYLEAWRVLNEHQWKERANWISGLFLHTFCRTKDGSGYWAMEEQNSPTADLLTGISGIIHFLVRSIHSEKMGYRILK